MGQVKFQIENKLNAARALLLCLLICVAGCGSPRQEKVSQAQFELSMAAIVSGVPLVGGVRVLAISKETPPKVDFKGTLDLNDSVIMPQGKWDIFLLGYAGPGAWQGTKYCGTTNVTLDLEVETVSLTLNQANCAVEPYLAMATEGQGRFDQDKFDIALWGP